MISSSHSELKEQFVVGSRSFRLWSGALKSPATITLFVLDLLPNLNKDESNSCRLSISFLFGRLKEAKNKDLSLALDLTMDPNNLTVRIQIVHDE